VETFLGDLVAPSKPSGLSLEPSQSGLYEPIDSPRVLDLWSNSEQTVPGKVSPRRNFLWDWSD
jgi:hypothetical protein